MNRFDCTGKATESGLEADVHFCPKINLRHNLVALAVVPLLLMPEMLSVHQTALLVPSLTESSVRYLLASYYIIPHHNAFASHHV